MKAIPIPQIILLFLALITFDRAKAQATDSIQIQKLEMEASGLAESALYREAITKQREVTAFYLGENKPEKYIEASLLIGKYYDRLGEVDSAVRHYTTLIPLTVEMEGELSPDRALIQHKIGVSYYRAYQYDAAVQAFLKAIDLRKKGLTENHKDIANSLFNLGIVYKEQMAYDKAISYFEEALKIRQHNNAQAQIAATLREMAFVYNELGDYERAIPHIHLAQDIFSQLYGKDDIDVADSYQMLGWLTEEQGNFPKAIEYLKEAIRIFNKLEVKDRLAQCYNDLGTVYLSAQDYKLALEYFKKAEKLNTELYDDQHQYVSKTQNNLGNTYMNLGQWIEAEEYLEASLENKKRFFKGQPHPIVAATHDNLGDLFAAQGKYKKAMRQYNLAIANLLPDYDPEPRYSLPTKEQLPYVNQKTYLLTILSNKAEAIFKSYQKSKDAAILDHCLQTYQTADWLIDQMRREFGVEGSKLLWLNKTRPLYEKAVQVALIQEDAAKAFYFMEKSKAVLLLEGRAERKAKSTAEIPEKLLQQDKQFNSKIFQLERLLVNTNSTNSLILADSLLNLRRKQEEFIVKLEKLYPKYYKHKYASQVVVLADFQELIMDDGDIVIQYLVGEEMVYTLVIFHDKTDLLQLEKPKNLPQLIRDFRRSVSDRSFITDSAKVAALAYREIGFQLYQNFLEQALKDLDSEETHHLTLIPDGPLNFVPFEALLTEDDGETDFASLPYLIRKYPVGYSYSASFFAENVDRTKKLRSSKNLLAIAPSYEGDSLLSPLPGAQKSMKKITDLYANTSILLNEEATKDNFLKIAENFKVLHLAMHGSAYENGRENPRLFFQGTDPILTTDEMRALDLNANLVVLSACETGLGEYARGEGVLSIARGFMEAGSSSLLMSLWKSNDQATEQIMTNFHEKILLGRSKDMALRLAKLDYLLDPVDGLGHPYYWAGFVLVGDHHSIQMDMMNRGLYFVFGTVIFLGLIFLFRR